MDMDMLNINSITSQASSVASNQATQNLANKAKNAETDEELMDACKEFENYLWEQVLKSMKSTVDVFGAEEKSGANSQMVDVFMDNAISDVSKSLTNQNMGPGSLAQQMYEQMKRNTISAADIATATAEEGLATGDIKTDEE